MTKTLAQLGEFGLIDVLRKNIQVPKHVLKGIGDDAAVIPLDSKKHLLLTTDMLVEDVHFTRKTDPLSIGRKAVACSLSDIAAMGGTPKFILISFGGPSKLTVDYTIKILKGMKKIADEFDAVIVGGDTVRANKIVINISVVGEVNKEEVVFRSGAKEGDRIFVTGPLGKSLQNKKHLNFIPRIKEAQYLTKNFKPSSMIDITDGLLSDLGHILKESSVGAYIGEVLVPLNDGAKLENALYDGEDFELLFTLSKDQADALLKVKENTARFILVGEIVSKEKGAVLVDKKGGEKRVLFKGYTHFRKKIKC